MRTEKILSPYDGRVVGEVAPQHPRARFVIEQRERGELREIHALVVDQFRFQAGVGEEGL